MCEVFYLWWIEHCLNRYIMISYFQLIPLRWLSDNWLIVADILIKYWCTMYQSVFMISMDARAILRLPRCYECTTGWCFETTESYFFKMWFHFVMLFAINIYPFLSILLFETGAMKLIFGHPCGHSGHSVEAPGHQLATDMGTHSDISNCI